MSEVNAKNHSLSAEPIVQPAPVATPPTSTAETEIDLLELFYRLLENWALILVLALVGAIVMGVYSFYFATPMYQATAKLYVVNSKDSAVNLSDLQIGAYLTKDYQEVFRTWEVHERVIQNLGLDYTYDEMTKIVSISNPSDTRILYITATTSDPQHSTDIANEYAAVARQYISDMMSTEEPNIMSVALRPTKPVSPNKTRNVLIGFILGAFLMAGIITIRFVLDDKIKTADDIARYADLPTLAIVPAVSGSAREGRPAKRSKSKRKDG